MQNEETCHLKHVLLSNHIPLSYAFDQAAIQTTHSVGVKVCTRLLEGGVLEHVVLLHIAGVSVQAAHPALSQQTQVKYCTPRNGTKVLLGRVSHLLA